MAKEEGGPAFLCPDHTDGMSFRDWIAGQALPAVITQCASDPKLGLAPEQYFAKLSYVIADAMIAERSK